MNFKRTSVPIKVVFTNVLDPVDQTAIQELLDAGEVTLVPVNHQTEFLVDMIRHTPHQVLGDHYNITAKYTLRGPLTLLFRGTTWIRNAYSASVIRDLYNLHPLFRAALVHQDTERGPKPFFAILPPMTLATRHIPEPPTGTDRHYDNHFPRMGFFEHRDPNTGAIKLSVAAGHTHMDGGGAGSLLAQFAVIRTLRMASHGLQGIKMLWLAKSIITREAPSVWLFLIPTILQAGVARLSDYAQANRGNTVEDIAGLRTRQDAVKAHPRFKEGVKALVDKVQPETLTVGDFGIREGGDKTLRGSFFAAPPIVYPLDRIRRWEQQNGHRGPGFNAACLVQSSFQLALELLTGKSVASRVTRDPSYAGKPIAYNSNSLLAKLRGNTLVDFHRSFGEIRTLQKQQKKEGYGTFETLPLEAYLEEIQEHLPDFDAGGLWEFNALDDRGNPMAPFIEFILADLMSRGLNYLGFNTHWTESTATFGNWYHEDPNPAEGQKPRVLYGPMINVSQVIFGNDFRVHVSTCKDRTEAWLAPRLATLTQAIMNIWLENPEANPRETLAELVTELKQAPQLSTADSED